MPLAAIRCVPISFGADLRTAQHQAINSPCLLLGLSSRRYGQSRLLSSRERAKDLNQKGIDEELSKPHDVMEAEREKQVRTPWHREGVDAAPATSPRSATVMTEGRILIHSLDQGLNIDRQASDHSIQASKDCVALVNDRSQLRPKRHRSARSACAPPPAPLLPGAVDTGRAS